MSMMHLKPIGLDTGLCIERFYGQVTSALAEGNRAGPLVLDCTWVTFVHPESIAALITAARLWHRVTGFRVHLQDIPLRVHQYLDRMDVFTQCSSWLVDDQPLLDAQRFDRSRNSLTLLEVLPIASEEEQNSQDIQLAHQRAAHIIDAWFDADEHAVWRLLTMFSEVASNVVHSKDRGFAVIQRYRRPGTRRDSSRVVMAIADLGIGIEASLRNKPAVASGEPPLQLVAGSQYLLHALRLGVTARRTIGGLGLSHVKGLVEQWDGLLEIRSRRSSIQARAEGVQERNDLPDIPGTQVTIAVQGGTGTL